MKYIKKVSVIFVCLLLAFFIGKTYNVLNVRADSGWDSSYDSGGSWDSGGWDSSDSWSSSDWDSDYGSSSSHSIYISSDNPVVTITIIVMWLIVITVIGYSILVGFKSKKRSNGNYLTDNKLLWLSIDEMKANLKQFENISGLNGEEIKQELYENYKAVQEAWMEFDFDKLRTLCGDELYNSYKTQLETLKLKNQKNIMKDFNLEDIYFVKTTKEKGIITTEVILKVSQKDYVVDESEKIVHGLATNIMHMTYKLTYEYKNADTTHCPNCNAVIDPQTSKCDYCGSIIVQGKDKFVLVRKEALNQRVEHE